MWPGATATLADATIHCCKGCRCYQGAVYTIQINSYRILEHVEVVKIILNTLPITRKHYGCRPLWVPVNHDMQVDHKMCPDSYRALPRVKGHLIWLRLVSYSFLLAICSSVNERLADTLGYINILIIYLLLFNNMDVDIWYQDLFALAPNPEIP